MSDPVLEFEQVSLTLGEGAGRTDALVDVNLTVEAGELVAITGRSGSGKSSLLNVAGGLYTSSSGVVRVNGVDLSALSPTQLATQRRRSVGFVFQDLNLIASLTAAENVALPLELDGMSVADARAQAESALTAVELDGLGKRFPDQLSGGQRQRVAIARGLVGERRLLLADEPTGALDEVTGEAIMEIMRRRCDEGAAALLVTHDPSVAAWGDRVVRIRDGRIDSITERPSVAADPADWQAS